jgi:tRNA threonylcarbamoyladenosine biosynthesis protein TsaE
MKKFKSSSTEETFVIAKELAHSFKPNTVVALRGDLGAGKTTFVKGIAKAFGADIDTISSPTFCYLNIYEAKFRIYHFDFYRLTSREQFETSGFEEFFSAGGITCIEWPDLAQSTLPNGTIFIDFRHCGEEQREISIHDVV